MKRELKLKNKQYVDNNDDREWGIDGFENDGVEFRSVGNLSAKQNGVPHYFSKIRYGHHVQARLRQGF